MGRPVSVGGEVSEQGGGRAGSTIWRCLIPEQAARMGKGHAPASYITQVAPAAPANGDFPGAGPEYR